MGNKADLQTVLHIHLSCFGELIDEGFCQLIRRACGAPWECQTGHLLAQLLCKAGGHIREHLLELLAACARLEGWDPLSVNLPACWHLLAGFLHVTI